MAKEGYKVSLNVYDLSQGLARQLSTTLLGKAIEGIWHTGLVVYGTEYNFGCGIQSAPVGTTPYGTPIRVVDLGVTHVPKDVFEMYLQEIGPRYTAETYSLLTHNCNSFSNEAAQFLVGASIPDYILNLPNEVMSSPMGALLLPMIQRLEATLRAGAVPQAPQFRPAMVAPPAQTGEATLRAGAVPQAPQFRPSMVAPPAQTGTSDRESLGASFDQLIRTKNEDVERESKREPSNCGGQQEKKDVSPACGAQEKTSNNGLLVDPLGDARNKVQEEISSEFSALMATGTIRASEAAALATKRVMQRYGHMNAEQS